MDDSPQKTAITLDTKKQLVKKQTAFSKLADAEIEELASLFIEKIYKAGETIVTEGDIVDSVFIIVKGDAEVRHVTIINGSPHIEPLAVLGPGRTIGLSETGLYSLSGVRTATVVALTDMLLLRLSVAQFNGFVLANSHVRDILAQNATTTAENSND